MTRDLDLVLDPDIRTYVFLAVLIITFCIGIIRHYVTILLETVQKTELIQIQDSHALKRSRLLVRNGHYLPTASYRMRKAYFNDDKKGYFKTQVRSDLKPQSMTDPTMILDMAKGNITNVIPMMIIGGWINYTFSGFVITRVPFPLTAGFKPMLQRDVELLTLDASWVSSASWYFLNVFGLQSIYKLVLGEDNCADQTRMMQDQMTGVGMQSGPDMKAAFRAAWEELECEAHSWTLKDAWKTLLTRNVPDNQYSKKWFKNCDTEEGR